ncbi:hypothetical protein [Lelliottia amnigena]|uniref:hypothetical protein n=1 Tax=Lelliottia amnigena TaxID=61646 RepID=UPI00192C7A77|nr:hypothetical protein [Lelliottia amnigena]MBL5929277.1 hypothetical protein [Lelliottia amnigena]
MILMMNNTYKGHAVAWPFLISAIFETEAIHALKLSHDRIEAVYEKGFGLLQFAAGRSD